LDDTQHESKDARVVRAVNLVNRSIALSTNFCYSVWEDSADVTNDKCWRDWILFYPCWHVPISYGKQCVHV